VSEILETPSTTKENQDLTHPEVTSLSDFNFSISVNVKVDPELIEALQKITSCLERIKPIHSEAVQVEQEPAYIENIPVKNEQYGQIKYNDTKWNIVPKYHNFKWRQDKDGKLHLKYYAGEVVTTWEEMEKLQAMNLRQQREEIQKFDRANNKKTAVRVFLDSVKKGITKKPVNLDEELEKNFSKFEAEEDPDAKFRPMVTPYHSTRPDENCGKVEGGMVE